MSNLLFVGVWIDPPSLTRKSKFKYPIMTWFDYFLLERTSVYVASAAPPYRGIVHQVQHHNLKIHNSTNEPEQTTRRGRRCSVVFYSYTSFFSFQFSVFSFPLVSHFSSRTLGLYTLLLLYNKKQTNNLKMVRNENSMLYTITAPY
jgi:hypothetical protein